jgi:hypothetical protein
VAIEIVKAWQRLGGARRIGTLAEKHGRVLESHVRYEERQCVAVRYPRLAGHEAGQQSLFACF